MRSIYGIRRLGLADETAGTQLGSLDRTSGIATTHRQIAVARISDKSADTLAGCIDGAVEGAVFHIGIAEVAYQTAYRTTSGEVSGGIAAGDGFPLTVVVGGAVSIDAAHI